MKTYINRLPKLGGLLFLLMLFWSPGVQAADSSQLIDQAVNAYKQKEYGQVVSIYNQYLGQGGSRVGRFYAPLAFMRGHAGYELFKRVTLSNYRGNYDEEIILPLTDSLKILRTDLIFKYDLLGRVYYDKLKLSDFRNLDAENNAIWYAWNSLTMRYEDIKQLSKKSDEYTTFSKYLIVFINMCKDIVENISSTGIYTYRMRTAIKLGFGSVYDERFGQLYEMTFFDNDNIKAGVLWQKGLDLMVDEKTPTNTVLSTFKQAISFTKGDREKAEIYRQMSDLVSQIDEPQRKMEAVEYGAAAYKLNPGDADIRRQYGSALHVVSYREYTLGREQKALEYAKKALEFDWVGNEMAYWDLSRAQAEFGQKFESIKNAKRAYEMAQKKYRGSEFAPYLQNYTNILRQFGEERRAQEVERSNRYSR